MMFTWWQLLLGGFAICLVQFLAALPWFLALTGEVATAPSRFRAALRVGIRVLVASAAGGAIVTGALMFEQDKDFLATVGRIYGAILYLQLVLDLFVLIFGILLTVWPRGGAVALSAFKEGIRQPLFWLLLVTALVILLIMPFIPYFTFGEELKMVKEIGNDIIMLAAGLFGVLVASTSISEEIEGRTAITLMSKPVSRRQFLVGKFLGIGLSSGLMTGILSVVYMLVLWFEYWYEKKEALPSPFILPNNPLAFVGGLEWWRLDVMLAAPGLILGFCQAMVFVAIAVALATRLPMVVNLVICLVVYFLGHLTPVLTHVSQTRLPLVRFMAQLFDTVLPALDYFNIGPALSRDTLPPFGRFVAYVGETTGYTILYAAIALLIGLLLFEDRDLA